ncbi:phage major capsid protein [Bacillus subtilis]|uniref:phage major capsid protein n=1 Tax=Bacillus subtilis TaxID=1423 RepID=UPI00100A0956|nr:phage major capsid protein [Bacillus subtilis]QAW34118.1 phage major capsid protein [Bacillus subtilis]QYX67853.1 phage major capsid protein [Bacillus subtilis]
MPTFNPKTVLLQDAVTGKIPEEQAEIVLKEFMQTSAITQLAKYEPMTKPVKTFTYLAEGPGAYWVGEGERIQTSSAKWLTAKMTSKKLAVIIPVSKEFLRYTVADFFTQMQSAIREAFAIKFDQAALFGVGSPFETGVSIMERVNKSGQKITSGTGAGSGATVYDDLAAVMALVEDADKDPDAFTTIRRFRQKLRAAKDNNGLPLFNQVTADATPQALGLPIGFVDSKSWDKTKADLITGAWDYARYGILRDIEYTISQDATLTTTVDEAGEPLNLFERDMFALRATMEVGFTTLAEDAFAALVPAVDGGATA